MVTIPAGTETGLQIIIPPVVDANDDHTANQRKLATLAQTISSLQEELKSTTDEYVELSTKMISNVPLDDNDDMEIKVDVDAEPEPPRMNEQSIARNRPRRTVHLPKRLNV